MQSVRNRRGIYAYRSVRRNGTVTSEYLGSGVLALLWIEDLAEGRAAKAAERAALAALKAADAELDAALAGLADEARRAARAELEAAGYRQHARGQWRLHLRRCRWR